MPNYIIARDGTLAKYGCEYVRRRKLCGKLEPGGTEEFQEDVTRQALDVFWMFIASYSAVHVNFELQYWLTDERGIFNWIDGPRRGGPPDFYKMVLESTNTLMLPTK